MDGEATGRKYLGFPHDRFIAGQSSRKGHAAEFQAGPMPPAAMRTEIGQRLLTRQRRLGIMSVVGALGTMLIANLGVALFIANERTLYHWDFIGYWLLSRSWALSAKGPLLDALKRLLHSIAIDDYNLLAAVPIGSWMALAGDSRMSYLLGVVNIYVTAVLLTFFVLVCYFWSDRDARQGPGLELIPAAALLLVPSFWVPVLRGFLDVGGLAVALVVLRLYFPSTKRSPFHPTFFGIGLLLASLYLFRRWYAFWVVSFLTVAALDRMALLCREWFQQGFSTRRALRSLLPIPVMGGVMGLTLAGFAWPLLCRVIATDYSDIYSGYNQGTSANLQRLLTQLGGAQVLYVLVGSVGLLAFRETRRMSLFLTVQAALTVYEVNQVQYFGLHHDYLLLPWILLIASVFTLKVTNILPGRWLRGAWLALVLALGLATSIPVFYGPARPLAEPLSRFVAEPCSPLVRTDIVEIVRMMSVLDQYLQQTGGRLYVLAASERLSSDQFLHATTSLPVPFLSADRVIPQCACVDKRDGFPKELLSAEFVMVATPIQYSLRPTDQQVMGIPAESMLNHTDIGRAFQRLPESFALQDGITAFLFKKTRAIDPSELAQLSERLRVAYPDRPYIYQP
jgi:hypothetical protein